MNLYIVIPSVFVCCAIAHNLYYRKRNYFERWFKRPGMMEDDVITINIHKIQKYDVWKDGVCRTLSRDVFGFKGVVRDIHLPENLDRSASIVIKPFKEGETEGPLVTISQEEVWDNPGCLLSYGETEEGDLLLKTKKQKMPRILRFALYSAWVALIWKFVNHSDQIVIYLANHFIK